MTALHSLLHIPTWRPNAASTPARPAFSSMALPLALEPWPIDSKTLAFHWTIGRPLPPPELLCCWGRPVLGTLFLRSAPRLPMQRSASVFHLRAMRTPKWCPLQVELSLEVANRPPRLPTSVHPPPLVLASPCPSRSHSFLRVLLRHGISSLLSKTNPRRPSISTLAQAAR